MAVGIFHALGVVLDQTVWHKQDFCDASYVPGGDGSHQKREASIYSMGKNDAPSRCVGHHPE